MATTLSVASRGRYAVFADASTFSRTQTEAGAEPDDGLPPEVQEARARGDAFIIHAEGDCEFSIGLFVDEAPPPELSKVKGRAKMKNALLRLPSGRLTLTPGEDIFTALDHLDPETSSSVDLEAGSYSLSAYDLTGWKYAERDRYVSENATPGEVWLNKLQNLAGCLGAVLIVGNILVTLPALIVLSMLLDWKRGLAWVLGVEVFLIGGFSVLDAFLTRAQGSSRVRGLVEAFEKAHPDILLLLNRVDDSSSQPDRGGTLKIGD